MSLQSVVSRRITSIWLVLVLAALMSWELGHGFGFSDPRWAGIAILVVAILKVRLIILDFMEVRYAPIPLRLAVEAWSVIVTAALLTMYRTPF